MKLVNPLHYPMAMLAGGIILVVGVRVAGWSNVVVLPAAVAVTTAGAALLKTQETSPEATSRKAIDQELKAIRNTVWTVAERASSLKLEAEALLKNSSQIELLSAVQYSCDRAAELPEKVEEMTSRLEGSEAVLSLDQLEKQLADLQAKLESSGGMARQQLA